MLPTLTEACLLKCRGCSALSRLTQRRPQYSPVRCLAVSSQADCHYDVLDLKQDATQTEIKAAFVRKSKMMHPDRNPDDPSMHGRFVRLNEAYTVLSRATTRREYDFTLAARLSYQQHIRRHQGAHSADGSHMPGSGTYHGGQGEKPFWDETIFEMRDRNKDFNRFYKEDEFYGVKGIRRVSNSTIVVACFLLMGIGVIMHFGAIQYSTHLARSILDERDRKAHAHLENARRRAREHGNLKQLEILKAKIDEKQNGLPRPPSKT